MIEVVCDLSEFNRLRNAKVTPHYNAWYECVSRRGLPKYDCVFEMAAPKLSPSGDIVMLTDSQRINAFSEGFCEKYRKGTIDLRVWLAYQDFVKSCKKKFVKPVRATRGEWKP